MATLTIKFIGIVTVVCMGSNPDPCVDPTSFNVYLPSAPNGSLVCKKDDPKAIRGHKAYIRVKEKLKPEKVENWNPIKCNDPVGECFLYPLDGDEIVIDGITNVAPALGTFPNPAKVDIIRWKSRKANPPALARYPDDRSIAHMSINVGDVSFNLEANKMYTTSVTINRTSAETKIDAEGPNGTKSLTITNSKGFDVIHLPKKLAQGKPLEHVHTDGRDHFYLHYLLAEHPPERDCCTPSITPECPYPPHPTITASKLLLDGGEGGGNVDCSNSVYP